MLQTIHSIHVCELVFGAYGCLEFGVHFRLRAVYRTEPCWWTGCSGSNKALRLKEMRPQGASESASH